MAGPTWKPYLEHAEMDKKGRVELPESVYAFPKQRKEPLTDAEHVRNAIARFDQVKGVSDSDRELAFANIEKAARHYGITIAENNWRQLGKQAHTKNSTH
ncbi:MAG: DUF6582 domain-containing protein [Anaerolineales bacterium]|jgi:hypothetical protein